MGRSYKIHFKDANGPLCGTSGLWKAKKYFETVNKEDVTCKFCLNILTKENLYGTSSNV